MNLNIDWAALLAPAAIQIGFLVYFLGRVRSQIDALGARLEMLETDGKSEKAATAHVGERIHELALGAVRVETLLGEIKRTVDGLCLEAAECPLVQGTPAPRQRRKGSSAGTEGIA